jgi:hypothetical protein
MSLVTRLHPSSSDIFFKFSIIHIPLNEDFIGILEQFRKYTIGNAHKFKRLQNLS